jgi:hypothetical protein
MLLFLECNSKNRNNAIISWNDFCECKRERQNPEVIFHPHQKCRNSTKRHQCSTRLKYAVVYQALNAVSKTGFSNTSDSLGNWKGRKDWYKNWMKKFKRFPHLYYFRITNPVILKKETFFAILFTIIKQVRLHYVR